MRVDQNSRRLAYLSIAAASAALLAGCNDQTTGGAKALRPIPSETLALMSSKGTTRTAPVLFRAFKNEAELEVWKMKADGTYVHLKTFPMCRWSGQLGPKVREGDRQVPEGFYAITPGQMNPNSAYYLAFNVGYPNAFDRAHGRTGGDIMVHGDCSSRGCFSMTDKQMAEIYAIAREAFSGGQRAIQMQSLPFRMNAENIAKYRFDPNMKFWKDLKKGTDAFEVTKREPQVGSCGRRYVFNATPVNGRLDAAAPCPVLNEDETVKALVAAKEQKDEQKVAELVAKGTKAIRTVYADGGQHPHFKNVDMVSRPDALAQGPQEIEIDERGKPVKSPVIQMAAVKAATPSEASSFAPASVIGAIASVATSGAAAPARPDPQNGEASTNAAVKTAPAVAAPATAAIAAKPAAAPAVTTIASSAPAAPAQPVAASASSGFSMVKKWLPTFGKSEEPAPVAAQPAAAPAPAAQPAQQRRAGTTVAPAQPAAKPQAARTDAKPKPEAKADTPPAVKPQARKPEQKPTQQAAQTQKDQPSLMRGASEPLPQGFRS